MVVLFGSQISGIEPFPWLMSVTPNANAVSGAHIFSICQFNTSCFSLHNCQCAGFFNSNKHSGSYNAISIEFAKTMRQSIPHSTPCSPCGPIHKQILPHRGCNIPGLRVFHNLISSVVVAVSPRIDTENGYWNY